MPLNAENMQLLIALLQLIFGVVFLVYGLRKLVAREYTPAARQSARIGQKGLRDNVSVVSQTATQLLNAVNQLVRTSAGVGAFLVLVGLFFMIAAYWVIR